MLSIWAAAEFWLFIGSIEAGNPENIWPKPGGAEAYLPISALMSLRYFFLTGDLHEAHPAGLVILSAVILISFIFGKSFCGWICPVGFISEMTGEFGRKIFREKLKLNIEIPRFLDYPLRSVKYILLAFFIYAIFFSMSEAALKVFMDSPYNLVADIKMYYFFAEPTITTLIVLFALLFAGVIFQNFWCRYFCPYGALLGIISFFSPNKIGRNETSCTDCQMCTKVCPSSIKVHKQKYVVSDECTSCMSCVAVCPVKETLNVKSILSGKKINPYIVSFGIIVIFLSVLLAGKMLNYWESSTPNEQIIRYHNKRNSLGHPRSAKEIEELNKRSGRDN